MMFVFRFFGVLAGMKISVQAMEVVNRLCTVCFQSQLKVFSVYIIICFSAVVSYATVFYFRPLFQWLLCSFDYMVKQCNFLFSDMCFPVSIP